MHAHPARTYLFLSIVTDCVVKIIHLITGPPYRAGIPEPSWLHIEASIASAPSTPNRLNIRRGTCIFQNVQSSSSSSSQHLSNKLICRPTTNRQRLCLQNHAASRKSCVSSASRSRPTKNAMTLFGRLCYNKSRTVTLSTTPSSWTTSR